MLSVVGFESDPHADQRDRWIAVALEELLARRLERVPRLWVIPTVRMYQGRSEIQDPNGATRDWHEVAGALGATVMLSGTCVGTHLETRLVLTCTPLETACTGRLPGGTGARRVELPTGRLFDVLDQATNWTLEQLGRTSLAPDQRRGLLAAPSESVAAVEYYARAVAALRAGKTLEAHRYASHAITRDKLFRPALLLLAQIEFSQRTPEAHASARRRLRTAADLARMNEDPFDRVRAEIGLALLVQAEGGFEAACLRIEGALALAYESGDHYGQLAAITAMSDLYLLRPLPHASSGHELPPDALRRFAARSVTRAAEWQEVLLDMLAAQNDTIAQVPAANKLAVMYEQLDRADDALRMHRRALELATQLRSAPHQATAWLYVGQWHRKQQQWPEALEAITRCLALAEPGAKPGIRIVLGEVYRGMQMPDDAAGQFQLALEELRRRDDLPRQLTCLRELAATHHERGRHDLALEALEEAIDVAHALESPQEALLREQLQQWRASPR